jgi:hypothetical protein
MGVTPVVAAGTGVPWERMGVSSFKKLFSKNREGPCLALYVARV